MKSERLKSLKPFILFIILLSSCNFSSKKDDGETDIEQFKLEANYLSQLAKENLNIINVCETLDTLKLQNVLQSTISVIKQEQNQIHSDIVQLADDNIVLIDNVAEENYHILDTITEETTEVKKALVYIQTKRDRQLKILENLEKIESDTKTKAVAKKLKLTIQSNIDITNKTLETLK